MTPLEFQVLLVEDNDVHVRVMQSMIASSFPGAKLSVAKNVEQARARLAQAPDVDLLIADVHLGEETCKSILQAFPRESRNFKTLLVTGEADPASTEELYDLGADDLLPKPVNGHNLLNRVSRLMKRSFISPRSFFESDSGGLGGCLVRFDVTITFLDDTRATFRTELAIQERALIHLPIGGMSFLYRVVSKEAKTPGGEWTVQALLEDSMVTAEQKRALRFAIVQMNAVLRRNSGGSPDQRK